MKEIRLTQYSHGAGCGCKIAPEVLDQVLRKSGTNSTEVLKQLLVGNATKDDAAVYAIGNGKAIISTTDFFMPIVDDPFDFGRIAGVNAISDIYAMGGTPLMAISILGWPINVLGPDVAAKVVEGGRKACLDAKIPLAGGHSIDSPEPIFGLAVTGIIDEDKIKRNSTATVGSILFLTKPLGVGILATAQKKGVLKPEHQYLARDQMIKLNSLGVLLGTKDYVTALTDVTGFGLLGHLLELCEGSNLNAVINFQDIPILEPVLEYLELGCAPGGTSRNWESYGGKIAAINELQKQVLCDPQTSGGLLVAVDPNYVNEFLSLLADKSLDLKPIGHLEPKQGEKYIRID